MSYYQQIIYQPDKYHAALMFGALKLQGELPVKIQRFEASKLVVITLKLCCYCSYFAS